MNPLVYVIGVPFLLGCICYLLPKKIRWLRESLALAGSAAGFGLTVWIFLNNPLKLVLNGTLFFKVDHLSGFTILAAGFFTFLIAIYSFKYMQRSPNPGRYFGALLWTFAATAGALMANHLLLLLVFWGFLGITLYLLILSGREDAAPAARKALAVIGGTDALMLMGIVLLYQVTGTFAMDKMDIQFDGVWVYTAFFFLLSGAFAKAGCMPLHTWIPDTAEKAPIPVTAFLPASLDKLLGIYLLARLSMHMFQMTGAVNLVLMIIGSFTILASVMMAMVQHDMRKLLAYHAVSQVGYMVLGIGTGTVLGVLGGLFHMINHTLYKTCLFLTAGSVKQQTGTTDLNKLGGLARLMPWTFVSFLIAALAISGIPPLNGFFSKWMIYQGLFRLKDTGDKLWVIWLFSALFGSGLTLASFMKLSHAVFLGEPSGMINKSSIKENGFFIVFPMAVMALLCAVFGIFAMQVPFKMFLLPLFGEVDMPGFYAAGPAALMIAAGMLIGFIIYLAGNLKNVRTAERFIGGEKLADDTRVTGTGFYNTVRDLPLIRGMYKKAAEQWFDIYEQGSRLAYAIGGVLRKAHTGLLNLYLLWVIFGVVVFLILLMGR